MAGTLTISTLSDGTNSTSSTNCIQGSAKAWVRFTGVSSATVQSSYNVSSVTRTSTGYYTVNFTNAMSDTNYLVMLAANVNGASYGLTVPFGSSSGSVVAPTTSSFVLATSYTVSGNTDANYVMATIFR